MNVAERFGANLRHHRGQAGLSQEETAVRASIHRTAVGMLERGERIARADTVARLAGALKIDPGELFDGITWESGGTVRGRYSEQ